ncbi:MAG: glucose-1-phosphate adenylyltransferase [Planctomycetaceae bacterium]|nr:glucose-1-phosphate adenylyltransferase [Planctomycetaceae bacterium]
MHNVLALILAGGKGTRLEPLTRDRAKPAVPFGGVYRIIDFTLSNCINSGLRKMVLLTQYKALSLDRHINLSWRFLCRELEEFIDVLPPEQRIAEQWYQGTADAVYQNIYAIEDISAEHILILAGDHIYKMDYSELVRDHIQTNADATIACLPVDCEQGRDFGVMGIDDERRVVRFEEKPESPFPMPGDPSQCLASMGIYVFKTKFLFDELCRDATLPASHHDFGKDIIPSIIHTHQVHAFPFHDKNTGKRHYWRDVGTLDAYYEANMDLVSVDPELNLYDQSWPIRNYHPPYPPPKFVFAQRDVELPRVGRALDSLVCAGTIVSGGQVERSILGPGVRINSWAHVEDSILFEGVDVGRKARVRRAIIDKRVVIPEGIEIGFDPDHDRERGFTITESGITVIGKQHAFKRP